MNQKNKVVISEKGKERILSGHKWIYRSDIIEPPSKESDVVFLYDRSRHFLGTALFSRDSQISLRIISRDEITDIARHIEDSLISALKYRNTLMLNGDCMRIVHSESDNLPGLIVDKYADTIVFQTLTRPMENLKDIIIKKIADILSPYQIFEKNDSSTRGIERLPEIVKTVYGGARENLFCTENHRIFYIDLINSQKTSEFLDQKINRSLVFRYAFGRVLDLFSYHSWFGCNIDNYDELVCVDSSEAAIEISKKNLEINNKYNYKTKVENVFDFLRDMDKRGEKVDTIVLDPPGFIKSKKDKSSGYAGYKEINLRAMRILKKGGVLATFSCSYYMSDEEFLRMIIDAAYDTRAEFIINEFLRQSPDHREILGFPESHYLKGYILTRI